MGWGGVVRVDTELGADAAGERADRDADPATRRRSCDLDDPRSALELVKDLVATANAGGGQILVGVDRAGTDVGIPDAKAELLDAGRLSDHLATFIRPDRMELQVHARPVGAQRSVVEITVPAAPEPPIVLSRPGEHATAEGRQELVFPARAVYVGRNGRAELARREDYRRWQSEAVQRATDEIVQRLSMVVEAPPGSRVRIVTEAEVLDEPRFLLSRSSDVFRQRPEHLLTGDDLAYLWLNRAVLELDDTARELIFQSALRKRATLYLWLTILRLQRHEVQAFLHRAVGMKDRDKSDAARSILLLAAMFLGDPQYRELIGALGRAGYAHMREAAEALPDRSSARTQLAAERGSALDGRPLDELPSARLASLADELLEGSLVRASRRVPPIGLELLRRGPPYEGGPDHDWWPDLRRP